MSEEQSRSESDRNTVCDTTVVVNIATSSGTVTSEKMPAPCHRQHKKKPLSHQLKRIFLQTWFSLQRMRQYKIASNFKE